MLSIKVPPNKLYVTYLKWINPILNLSKGEMDILANMLQLQAAHRYYNKEVLTQLLTSQETKDAIRTRLKINTRLFNKLYKSLETKQLISSNGIHPSVSKYPVNGRLKLFISIECNK